MFRKIIKLISLTFVLLLLLSLSACSSNLSGTYVNMGNNTETLSFSGKNFILQSSNNQFSGTYRVSGDNLILSFNHGSFSSDEYASLRNNNKTIVADGYTFVKESGNSGIPWWGWVLIIIIGFSVVNFIYKAITKRDLSDDIEKAVDKMDE